MASINACAVSVLIIVAQSFVFISWGLLRFFHNKKCAFVKFNI